MPPETIPNVLSASGDQPLPPMLTGVAELAGKVDALILDIYGVLHDGIRAYPPTIRTLKEIREAGIKTCLLSNTPLLRTGTAEQLQSMGITPDLYDYIVTAGDSARDALEPWLGRRVYLTETRISPGSGLLRYAELIEGLDLDIVDDIEQADVILNQVSGLSATQEAPLYRALDRALARGLPMICANPDLIVMVGRSVAVCAGTYAEYYQERGGHVSWHGKPHAPVYQQAFELLGKPDKARMAGIGDALRTDVAGALAFGIIPVWNMEGIHRAEVMAADGSCTIDPVLLAKVLEKGDARPAYVLDGFAW